jgi:integrase/recombinase XerC
MGRDDARPGAASLVLVDGVPLLHPETQVFEAMLEGWRNQGAGPQPGSVDTDDPGGSGP